MIIENHFHNRRFCTWPRFKTEACGISEMAYSIGCKPIKYEFVIHACVRNISFDIKINSLFCAKYKNFRYKSLETFDETGEEATNYSLGTVSTNGNFPFSQRTGKNELSGPLKQALSQLLPRVTDFALARCYESLLRRLDKSFCIVCNFCKTSKWIYLTGKVDRKAKCTEWKPEQTNKILMKKKRHIPHR